MKNKKFGAFVFSVFLSLGLISAQTNITDTAYQQLKLNGALDPTAQYNIINTNSSTVHHIVSPAGGKATNCACYTPHDATWTLAMPPNDDDSSPNIPIPFNFCLYGTNYTSLWINNNGNITFDAPYATFSAVGFPDPSYVMVAPFWGDVDTWGVGEVWYKITPTALYVNWENVGYFSAHTDKTNTFSLIISDGNDPVIGVGNNVAFCYQDMQWTTGDASSGINGFGGVAATVGCNKGDGISFVQFGRFDSPGTTYFGPYATNSGVSWLDNQSFIFNACNATNISPVIANGFGQCDTIRLCQGDTLLQTIDVLSPEAGQITVVNVTSLSPQFTLIDTTSGNTAQATFQIIGNSPGFVTVSVNAVDNGTPPQNVTFDLIFEITPNTTPDPVITTDDTTICPGVSTVLNVPSIYDTYLWSTSSTVDSTTVSSGGIYSIMVELNGCKQYDSITIVQTPSPTLSIPDSIICLGVPVDYNATSNDTIVTYDWTFASGTPSSSTNSNPQVIYNIAGSFPVSLTISNAEGCTTTVNQNMQVLNSVNPDFGVYPICISRFTFDPLPGLGDSTWVIDWNMGDGTLFDNQDTSIFNYLYPAPGDYLVSMTVVNSLGCSDTVYKLVEVLDTLSIIMPNVFVHSSTVGNNKFDLEVIKPNFNLCVEYTFTVFDRWGIKMYEAYNDPHNADLFCGDCFKGKSEQGATLSPGIYYYVFEGNFNILQHGFFTIFD